MHYAETLFNNLQARLTKPEFCQYIREFQAGDMSHREQFIKAHIRLATSIAIRYGQKYRCDDDLVDVVMIELCEFPDRVKSDGLLYGDGFKYLLSRLHTVCGFAVRQLSLVTIPFTTMRTNGRKPFSRSQVPPDNNIGDEDRSWHARNEREESEMIELLRLCVETEFQRIYINKALEGYTDTDIARMFGCQKNKIVLAKKKLFDTFIERYGDRCEFLNT